MGILQGLSTNQRGHSRSVAPEQQHSLFRTLPGTEAQDDCAVSGCAGCSAGDCPTEHDVQGHKIGGAARQRAGPLRSESLSYMARPLLLGSSTAAAAEPLPTFSNCTKSLRDSFGLTALILPEGILSCTAVDRTRDAVRLPPWTWGMDGRTLFPSEERTDTILIPHKPCHSAPQTLACESEPPL